jgi:hypothetical protein
MYGTVSLLDWDHGVVLRDNVSHFVIGVYNLELGLQSGRSLLKESV